MKNPAETPAQKAEREAREAANLQELDADTPAWAKALIEQNKSLAQSVAVMQGDKVAATVKGKATDLLKDVPVSYWGKRPLPKEEELEAFVAEVTTDYTAFKQEMTDAGLSVLSTPKGGNTQKDGKVTPASKEEVSTILESIM